MSADVTKGLAKAEGTRTPMSFEEFGTGHAVSDVDSGRALPGVDAADELDWLMSLALDDALDAGEAARLDVLLRQAPKNMERWSAWQALDHNIHQIPSVLPPTDFGEKFARRLEIQERQRRLRTGVIFGVAAAALWASALVGLVVLGALVWSNQGEWIAGLVHGIAYWWAAALQFGQVFLNTFEALWTAPQTRALLACYFVAAMAILAGWFMWLRRSTHEMPIAEAQLIEA